MGARAGSCDSVMFFFFKQKAAYEMRISDWSSDVCSSDLAFHVHTTHPQWTTAYSDHLHRYDVFDIYSRVIIPAGLPSHQLRWIPREPQILNTLVGAWDDNPRTEESRVGEAWVRTCRYLWYLYHKKKKKKKEESIDNEN